MRLTRVQCSWLLSLCGVLMTSVLAGPRARELGLPFDGTPGPLNAITDVAGVTVGQVTLVDSHDDLHQVRTGVTAVVPRGALSTDLPVFAGTFALNGNGEMTGTAWVEESGFLEGPVLITNTHSVGVVRDAAVAWRVSQRAADATGYFWSLPVVAETWDGYLNDVNGFHVTAAHVFEALEGAHAGPVEEGNVGGGTGMICHEFKCGTGSASRRVSVGDATYTVGVLVQANYGIRDTLRIAGVPIGQHLRDHRVFTDATLTSHDLGSIIIVVATDAPLLPHQLKRVARRAGLGIARNGSFSGNGSGDLFIAFSTANAEGARDQVLNPAQFLGNDALDPVFQGTVEAVEEAVINSMVAATEMHGQQGHYAIALSHPELQALLKRYNRLALP